MAAPVDRHQPEDCFYSEKLSITSQASKPGRAQNFVEGYIPSAPPCGNIRNSRWRHNEGRPLVTCGHRFPDKVFCIHLMGHIILKFEIEMIARGIINKSEFERFEQLVFNKYR